MEGTPKPSKMPYLPPEMVGLISDHLCISDAPQTTTSTSSRDSATSDNHHIPTLTTDSVRALQNLRLASRAFQHVSEPAFARVISNTTFGLQQLEHLEYFARSRFAPMIRVLRIADDIYSFGSCPSNVDHKRGGRKWPGHLDSLHALIARLANVLRRLSKLETLAVEQPGRRDMLGIPIEMFLQIPEDACWDPTEATNVVLAALAVAKPTTLKTLTFQQDVPRRWGARPDTGLLFLPFPQFPNVTFLDMGSLFSERYMENKIEMRDYLDLFPQLRTLHLVAPIDTDMSRKQFHELTARPVPNLQALRLTTGFMLFEESHDMSVNFDYLLRFLFAHYSTLTDVHIEQWCHWERTEISERLRRKILENMKLSKLFISIWLW